jgi:hypothetical protein
MDFPVRFSLESRSLVYQSGFVILNPSEEIRNGVRSNMPYAFSGEAPLGLVHATIFRISQLNQLAQSFSVVTRFFLTVAENEYSGCRHQGAGCKNYNSSRVPHNS